MKAKNLIFITLILVIVLIGILVTIFLLASTPVNTDITPISTPVSMPGETFIEIGGEDINDFDIALINSDDTILLKNEQGERIPLNLDKKSWKDIRWSTDGKLVSVLGKTGEDIYDIFIFNLNTKSWRQATHFEQSSNGIGTYLWRDNNVLLFTQGASGLQWIHQYVYNSGEITKLTRIDSVLFAMAEDARSMVVKLNDNNDSTSFAMYKTDGTLIYNLSKVTDTATNQPLNIKNITYTKSSDNIVLTSTDGKLYKHIFGNSSAVEITNAVGFYPICGVTNTIVAGLQQNEQGMIFLDTINIDDTPVVNLATLNAEGKSIDFSKTKCYKVNNAALNVDGVWYKTKTNEFEEFDIIESAKEVAFRTIN